MNEEKGNEKGLTKLSKKKRKQMKRMQVAQLKVLVKRPDLVEVSQKNRNKRSVHK